MHKYMAGHINELKESIRAADPPFTPDDSRAAGTATSDPNSEMSFGTDQALQDNPYIYTLSCKERYPGIHINPSIKSRFLCDVAPFFFSRLLGKY
jgi:hypothetical protein